MPGLACALLSVIITLKEIFLLDNSGCFGLKVASQAISCRVATVKKKFEETTSNLCILATCFTFTYYSVPPPPKMSLSRLGVHRYK